MEWLQFVANAGGPAMIALAALWVISQIQKTHQEERIGDREKFVDLANETIRTVKEFTAASSQMAQILADRNPVLAGLVMQMERSNDVLDHVRACLDDNIRMYGELNALLARYNGDAAKKVAKSTGRKRKKQEEEE